MCRTALSQIIRVYKVSDRLRKYFLQNIHIIYSYRSKNIIRLLFKYYNIFEKCKLN